MRELPTGTVTFLFTDVEGSTKLLRELGADAYAEALGEHRRVIRDACAADGGVEVDTQGDAFFFAFPTAPGAVAAASAFTESLASGPIKVRVGLHTGTPLLTDEGYVGDDVHRAARIAASGHGGQVLVSVATAPLVESELRDLGDHRFKDLSAPERVYQLGDGEFPALKSLFKTNLPIPATPFLGRERELAEVAGLLQGARLLTLTGPGGTGKTRLAAQAAGLASDGYPDGVWWVSLAPLGDATLVLQTAAQVVGSRNGLSDHVADKAMLILFDNFEHVTESAGDLALLLASCPRLSLLVTSREPLHLSGEQAYAVPPLAHEEGVGFFLARARAVKPDFRADEAVSEICRRLDDLPLALELAAARTTALSSQQILERLDERLPLLTGGARDLPERQQTLRAAIAWSYDLLSEEEQQLFRRLSAFAGGCTLEAAEDVCEADIDRLQSLVDKSLVRSSDERYWLLETIREYASERLAASGELEENHRRHARSFVELSEMYGPELQGPKGAEWFPRLEAEVDNVRAAVSWGLAHDRIAAFTIAVNTSYFWLETGRMVEGARLLDASWVDDCPVDLKTRALRARTAAAMSAGDAQGLIAVSTQRVDLARATGDADEEARALSMLASGCEFAGDHARARGCYVAALEIKRRSGTEEHMAALLMNTGRFERQEGDLARSRELLEEGLAISRAEANELDIAYAVKELAQTAIESGARDEAKELLSEGFEIAGRLKLEVIASDLVTAVALLAARTDQPHEGAVLFGAVDASDERLGFEHPPELPYWGKLRGELIAALGESTFEPAFAQGRLLSLDAAVEQARKLIDA